MLWAIGTQVLLANPLSVIMFSVVVSDQPPAWALQRTELQTFSSHRCTEALHPRCTQSVTDNLGAVQQYVDTKLAQYVAVLLAPDSVPLHLNTPLGWPWDCQQLGSNASVLLTSICCCFLIATVVQVQRFFQRRIAAEEQLLRRFFGLQYEQYASVTPTWMPGIP
jgi:protein-S-isoprenylcysteine O-methyltransferase Ste14